MDKETLQRFLAPGDKDEHGRVVPTMEEHEVFAMMSAESAQRIEWEKNHK
jgi:hypothetical protein